MKEHSLILTLTLALALAPATSLDALAEIGHVTIAAPMVSDERGFGFTSGVVGIVEGQTARLTVWNKSDKPILARLQFIDDQGKVLFLCNAVIDAGKAAAENLNHTGGANRVNLLAQFGTIESKEIGLLVPTFEVIDNQSGANAWMFGQEGFTEIRPIFVPPLVAPF